MSVLSWAFYLPSLHSLTPTSVWSAKKKLHLEWCDYFCLWVRQGLLRLLIRAGSVTSPSPSRSIPAIRRYHGNVQSSLQCVDEGCLSLRSMFSVCIRNTYVKLSTRDDQSGMSICIKWSSVEFPLLKDGDKWSRLPPFSLAFLFPLYSFGSAESRGDLVQALSSFSHTQHHMQK